MVCWRVPDLGSDFWNYVYIKRNSVTVSRKYTTHKAQMMHLSSLWEWNSAFLQTFPVLDHEKISTLHCIGPKRNVHAKIFLFVNFDPLPFRFSTDNFFPARVSKVCSSPRSGRQLFRQAILISPPRERLAHGSFAWNFVWALQSRDSVILDFGVIFSLTILFARWPGSNVDVGRAKMPTRF